MAKSTQRDFIVTAEGLPGNWRGFTGGGATSEATKDRDGGATRQTLTPNPFEYEDIEISRAFDPIVDGQMIRDLRKRLHDNFTLSKQPTDVNKIAIGDPTVYPDCLLTGLSEQEAGDSGDHATVSLTFATTGPAD